MIARRNVLFRTVASAALFGGAAAFGLIKLAFAAEKVGSAQDVVNQAWGTPPGSAGTRGLRLVVDPALPTAQLEQLARDALSHHADADVLTVQIYDRSEEHTSELQSLFAISYAVFCLDRKSVV